MLKDNIVMLRKINGYSQEEVAEKIGISRQAVSNWDRGVAIPDVETLRLLAEALEVEFHTVLTGAPPKPPASENRAANSANRTLLLILNFALFAVHLAVALCKKLDLRVLLVPGFLASFALLLFFLFRHVITQNDFSIMRSVFVRSPTIRYPLFCARI